MVWKREKMEEPKNLVKGMCGATGTRNHKMAATDGSGDSRRGSWDGEEERLTGLDLRS